MDGSFSLMAVTSSKVMASVSIAAEVVPSSMVFAPSCSNIAITSPVAPLPTETIIMTEAIPIIMPSMVSRERILLLRMLSRAIFRFSKKLIPTRPRPYSAVGRTAIPSARSPEGFAASTAPSSSPDTTSI